MDQSTFFFALALTVFIHLILLYLVIRFSVSKETKETVNQLMKIKRMLYLNLKQKGITDDEIFAEIAKDQKDH